MNILDDILATLDLEGALYFRTDFSPPWAIAVPKLDQAARFHLVLQGGCHVTLESGRTVDLGPGDLILIPRGQAHVLSDRPGRQPAALESVLQEAGYSGDGLLVLGRGEPEAGTRMVCGHFSFRQSADHPLLRALPSCLLITAADRAAEPWMDDLVQMIPRRLFTGQVGSEEAATRLSGFVFGELIRFGIRRHPKLKSILAALSDRFIGRALQLIHTRPEQPWTVDALARAIGMSRSRFADRFSRLLGVGPMGYLADWRLQKALALLNDTRTPVQKVAEKSGYRSPAAFTRAFAGRFGLSPTEYRRSNA